MSLCVETDSENLVTSAVTSKIAINKKARLIGLIFIRNSLILIDILLAPRPGLEPGTYGLTVALKDVLNSSRFSLIFINLLILCENKYYMT